jgi:hypothetical protein
MKPCLVKRGKQYAVKYFDTEKLRWSHQALGTDKRAIADLRFGDFIRDQQKKELLGNLGIEPIALSKLVSEFLEYMESKRSPRYVPPGQTTDTEVAHLFRRKDAKHGHHHATD